MLAYSAPALDPPGVGRWTHRTNRPRLRGLRTRTSSGADDGPDGDNVGPRSPDPTTPVPSPDPAASVPKDGVPEATREPTVAEDFAKNRHGPRATILGQLGRKPIGENDTNTPAGPPET